MKSITLGSMLVVCFGVGMMPLLVQPGVSPSPVLASVGDDASARVSPGAYSDQCDPNTGDGGFGLRAETLCGPPPGVMLADAR